MKFPLRSTFCIFLILLPLLLSAQKQLSKDMLGTNSKVCVEVANAQELMQAHQKGVSVFIPAKGNQSKLVSIFTKLKQITEKKQDSGYIIINQNHRSDKWEEAIIKAGLSKRIVTPESQSKNDIFYYKLKQGDILSFSSSGTDLSYSYDELIREYTRDSTGNKLLTNDFLITRFSTKILPEETDSIFNQNWSKQRHPEMASELNTQLQIWLHTGKRPHFIKCKQKTIDAGLQLCKILNKVHFHSAYFTKENKAFAPVQLKEIKSFLGGGRVCIPMVLNDRPQISPKSRGFRFSPDIFRFTDEHKWHEIVINAFPLAIEQKQIAHFHFDDAQMPVTPPIDNIFSTSDALLIEDEQRGKVFAFNGKSDYIDCGSTLDIDFTSPITISAWIKPEYNHENHSIVGLGNSFTMKIQRKQLTFTSPDVRDTKFPGNEIKLNTWQHVTIVFEPNERMSLYQDGELLGSTEAVKILRSQHSIVIGSNVWGEYYKGLMDDLQIWNRALSDDEIKHLSQWHLGDNNWIKQMIIAIASSFLIIVLLILYRRSKKTEDKEAIVQPAVSNERPVQATEQEKPRMHQHQSSILTFGEFRIFTAEGNNLVPRLSPKEKQLLLYLLWHSTRNKKEGVTSRQMSEDLWPNMSADKAKNNRSTYMQRLRKQLTDSTGIQINYASNKKWCLVIPSHYHCDLLIYNDALLNLQNKSNVDNLQTLLNSLSEGSFLPETHSDVTDVFKSEIENEIIIMLTKPEIISLAEDQINILPKLTATIRKYDPLNETALSLEINWFHKMGHHGRTLETYQRFCREYELLFGEKFNTEMEELIN
ncbi:MAG: hypothetical protein N4A71_27705 [Carboxylicivirga sp.]|jgi:two-component SAPR family response regulator|nr:hypothetical protein [Carboxylicivirga sp.]